MDALEAVRDLVAEGFGELETLDSPAPKTKLPAPRPEAQPSSGVRSSGPLGVSPGLAVGPIVRMSEPVDEPVAAAAIPVREREAAAERIVAAAASVALALRDKATRVSGAAREILEATALMAVDPGLLGAAADHVTGQGHSPERAVWTAVGEIAAAFKEQGGLLAERVPDLHDVRNCIVSELLGRPAPGLPDRVEPYVLVARDLAPADTALIDPTVCRGIVTVDGGPTSRTAILVRSLGLPAWWRPVMRWTFPKGAW